MRIMYVTDALAIWGGIERILVEKVNYLAGNYNDTVCLLTVNQGNHPIPYPLSEKVIYQDLGILFHKLYKYNWILRIIKSIQLQNIFVKKLKNIIDEFNPDIIVLARPKLASGIIKSKGSVPLVFESHSSYKGQFVIDSSFYTRLKNYLDCRSLRHAQHVVALTQGDAESWQELNPKVSVIPNFVHLFKGSVFAECEAKSVIFVGRFSRQKDIRSLLNIWKIVHNYHPTWQLQIYGGYGEIQDDLLDIINNSNLNIQVFKPTFDIMEKYMENSILIMTSIYEPFGLVLPEAMSCGLPVVAFDCPYGPREIITDGKDGFLIQGRDIQQFAEKVCLLIESPILRRHMGQAGVLSSQRYRAEDIMPRWKSLFEELISVH